MSAMRICGAVFLGTLAVSGAMSGCVAPDLSGPESTQAERAVAPGLATDNADAFRIDTQAMPMSSRITVPERDPGTVPDGMSVFATGNPEWISAPTRFGLMLQGGGRDNDDALKWMIARSGGGDVVVLRTDARSGYNDYIYSDLGGVNSVRTLVVSSPEFANSDYVERSVMNAEMLFITGGDQTTYFDNWQDSKLRNAIFYLAYIKRVPIGGTSAGMSALSRFAYFPVNLSVISPEALANPYDPNLDFIRDNFLALPFMWFTIADPHWSERRRSGRTIGFLARIIQDGLAPFWLVKGISADERTALTIDGQGNARIYGAADRNDYAYFLRPRSKPDRCVDGSTLDWRNAISAYKLRGFEDGRNVFNLLTWTGSGGEWLDVNVSDGVLSADIQSPN